MEPNPVDNGENAAAPVNVVGEKFKSCLLSHSLLRVGLISLLFCSCAGA